MFKPFFVHHNSGPGHLSGRWSRGFTVYVQPNLENQREVLVSGAWCNAKDAFVKAEGRAQALKANTISINKRQLPQLLCSMTQRTAFQVDDGWFDYLYRYML